MTIETKHNLNEDITVDVDSSLYTGKIKEIHIVAISGNMDVGVAYSADVSKEFNDKQKDGTYKKRTDVRRWFGRDEDIK